MLHVYAECLGLRRDVGDTGNLPLALEGLAAAATALGDRTSAARLLGCGGSISAQLTRCQRFVNATLCTS
jgi:hypothetical protein